MRDKTKVPAIPGMESLPADVQRVVRTIKETMEVREGVRGNDYLDKGVTYRDLVELGLITESQVPEKE